MWSPGSDLLRSASFGLCPSISQPPLFLVLPPYPALSGCRPQQCVLSAGAVILEGSFAGIYLQSRGLERAQHFLFFSQSCTEPCKPFSSLTGIFLYGLFSKWCSPSCLDKGLSELIPSLVEAAQMSCCNLFLFHQIY